MILTKVRVEMRCYSCDNSDFANLAIGEEWGDTYCPCWNEDKSWGFKIVDIFYEIPLKED